MKKTVFVILWVFIVGCFYDPPSKGDRRLIVYNKTTEEIYCYPSFDGTLNELHLVLDNKIGKSNSFLFDIIQIRSGDNKFVQGAANWDEFINLNGKDSTITIFVFSKKLVENIGWSKITASNLYTKKYTYNSLEMAARNWKISYTAEK